MRLTTAVVTATALTMSTFAVTDAAGAAPVSHTAVARRDWTSGAHAAVAEQARYWTAARHQLASYGKRDTHERSDLTKLLAIPPTDTTATQRAMARRATRELNGFFRTPGLYGVASGHPKSHARTDWITSAHVAAAERGSWLAAAVDELDAHRKKFASERADLQSLQSIPLTDTTAAQRAAARRDARALDTFFHTPGLNY